MNRHSLLAALVVLAGGVTFLSAVPTGIRGAQGCSGAPQNNIPCTSPGWTSVAWEVDPTGVPTNGGAKVLLGGTYSCTQAGPGGAGGAGGGSSVTLSVTGPDGAVVPGTPTTIAPPPPSLSTYPTLKPAQGHATWRPDAPLAPATTYTLHVAGVASGEKTLSFTTGSGPFGPLKAVLVDPVFSTAPGAESGPQVCCNTNGGSVGSCGPHTVCTQQMRELVPAFSGKADADEPVASVKALLDASVELSIDDGPFGPDVSPAAAKSKVCARAHVVNTVTGDVATSEPVCKDVASFDLKPVGNCGTMESVLQLCGIPSVVAGYVGTLTPSKDEVLSLYGAACGKGGAGGSSGGAGSGGSAAGAAGSAAGSGGAAMTDRAADDDGGCSVSALQPRAAGGGGLAALFAVLGLALRKRRGHAARVSAP